MSAVLERVDPMVTLARMQADLAALAGLDLTGLSDEALLEYARAKERTLRQFPTLDHALILEVEDRGLPSEVFLRRTGQWLRGLLRIDPGEAAGGSRPRTRSAGGGR